MYAICVESSHSKGMGHFFRALNFITYLNMRNEKCVMLVNRHDGSLEILEKRNIQYEIVPLADLESNWEKAIINNYGITTWINDRLDTDIRHAQHIINAGVRLVTFDDRGSGASAADLHIAAMVFDDASLPGKHVLKGPDYLVLNPDIERFRRQRTQADKILVSMGGSDTHGVTIKVVESLKKTGSKATVIIGPAFEHDAALEKILTPAFIVKHRVPSLMEEFSHHDLAITGGGVTPFEANACGLPCIIIANEVFEIPNAKYLERQGSSVFAGFHADFDASAITNHLDIKKMSRAGMTHLSTNGAHNIYQELARL